MKPQSRAFVCGPRLEMLASFAFDSLLFPKTQAVRICVILLFVGTVARCDGLRVVIHTNDHRPANVHVIGKGSEAVFVLSCPSGPVRLRENYGFNQSDVTRIRRCLTGIVTTLCEEWEKIHGSAW
jgi:hypothetical protein